MSLATVGNKATDEQSLGELLTDVRRNIQLIENHDARISQEYKVKCKQFHIMLTFILVIY